MLPTVHTHYAVLQLRGRNLTIQILFLIKQQYFMGEIMTHLLTKHLNNVFRCGNCMIEYNDSVYLCMH